MLRTTTQYEGKAARLQRMVLGLYCLPQKAYTAKLWLRPPLNNGALGSEPGGAAHTEE